jgi:hypothetical protein
MGIRLLVRFSILPGSSIEDANKALEMLEESVKKLKILSISTPGEPMLNF